MTRPLWYKSLTWSQGPNAMLGGVGHPKGSGQESTPGIDSRGGLSSTVIKSRALGSDKGGKLNSNFASRENVICSESCFLFLQQVL